MTAHCSIRSISRSWIRSRRRQTCWSSKRALPDERSAEAAERERIARTRLALQEQFGVSGLSSYYILLGAKPLSLNDQPSAELARDLLDRLDNKLRERNLHTAQLPSGAYASPTYDLIMDGRMDAIADAGLTDHGRMTVVATVKADCGSASSVAGIVTCAGRVVVRSLSASVSPSARQTWVEQGAGVSQRDALAQTAEFLAERHVDALLVGR
jgi:hypothetical protein